MKKERNTEGRKREKGEERKKGQVPLRTKRLTRKRKDKGKEEKERK